MINTLVQKHQAWFVQGLPTDWRHYRGFYVGISYLKPNESGTEKNDSDLKKLNKPKIQVVSLCGFDDDDEEFVKYFDFKDKLAADFSYRSGTQGVKIFENSLRSKKYKKKRASLVSAPAPTPAAPTTQEPKRKKPNKKAEKPKDPKQHQTMTKNVATVENSQPTKPPGKKQKTHHPEAARPRTRAQRQAAEAAAVKPNETPTRLVDPKPVDPMIQVDASEATSGSEAHLVVPAAVAARPLPDFPGEAPATEATAVAAKPLPDFPAAAAAAPSTTNATVSKKSRFRGIVEKVGAK